MVQEISLDILENRNEIKVKKSYCLFLFCYNFLVSIFFIPVICLDLYYHFTDDSCKDSFYISLKYWLSINGYTNLGSLFFIYLYTTILTLLLDDEDGRKKHNLINRFLIFIKFVLISFQTGWIVFGYLIFFRYTESCKSNIYYYTLIRLLYQSILLSFYIIFTIKKR